MESCCDSQPGSHRKAKNTAWVWATPQAVEWRRSQHYTRQYCSPTHAGNPPCVFCDAQLVMWPCPLQVTASQNLLVLSESTVDDTVHKTCNTMHATIVYMLQYCTHSSVTWPWESQVTASQRLQLSVGSQLRVNSGLPQYTAAFTRSRAGHGREHKRKRRGGGDAGFSISDY